MIVPLTDDAAWMKALGEVPMWTAPRKRTVVIAPHPDDEALAAGGLIAGLRVLGVEVTVVAVTDGDRAYGDTPDAALGRLRVQEQTAALERLGVAPERIVRLHLPDSEVALHEVAIVERLRTLVDEETHLIAPWTGDFHPDHEACGRAAQQLARLSGAQLSYWFFWTWHRGTPQTLRGLKLGRIALSEEQQVAKAQAIACHASQLYREDGEPILPYNLLSPARWPFEVFLPA